MTKLNPVWPLGLEMSEAGGHAKKTSFSAPNRPPKTASAAAHQSAAEIRRVASNQTRISADKGSRTAESPKSVKNLI